MLLPLLQVLTGALQDFQGAIVAITHNPAFAAALNPTHILRVQGGNAKLSEHVGPLKPEDFEHSQPAASTSTSSSGSSSSSSGSAGGKAATTSSSSGSKGATGTSKAAASNGGKQGKGGAAAATNGKVRCRRQNTYVSVTHRGHIYSPLHLPVMVTQHMSSTDLS